VTPSRALGSARPAGFQIINQSGKMAPHADNPEARPPGISLSDAVFNHLVLPAKLPQQQDSDIDSVEGTIISAVLQACKIVAKCGADDVEDPTWVSIIRSIQACSEIHHDGRLDRAELLGRLRHLAPGDSLILHIQTQNAGLLIRRDHE
jgi:hypothetical protein